MVNVLIVDDDEELLEMVCLMIEANHMTATCVDRGSEVFPSLAAAAVDLVLMDIYLDNYDGRKISKEIKTDDRYGQIPVLLYSAGNIDAASVRESLADAFIQKPFDMPVLIEKIRGMVKS